MLTMCEATGTGDFFFFFEILYTEENVGDNRRGQNYSILVFERIPETISKLIILQETKSQIVNHGQPII